MSCSTVLFVSTAIYKARLEADHASEAGSDEGYSHVTPGD